MKKLFQLPSDIGWRDQILGATMAILVTAWLLSTADAIGFARDEGFYFRAATQYAEWFNLLVSDPSRAFSRATIDRIWGYNHEHPSLIKSLFSLSWLAFHEKWKVFSHASDAFRLPAMALSGVAVWVTYLFGARVYSRTAGLIAACLFLLTPRVFYHAHLACFDLPIVALWTLCIYIYWRSIEKGGLGWALLAGVVYGLTLDTKHNAWILPAVFLPHAVLVVHRHLRRDWKDQILRVPTSLLAMAIVGPLVFWALWPWMWHDTAARLREYFDFHFNHVYYNMEFLGTNYFDAPSPRAYMPLMIAATVPSITLLLCAVGAGQKVRGALGWLRAWKQNTLTEPERPTYPDMLFALAIIAAISPWFFAKTPIFGGTKHWMTAYPFMALFAAHGLELSLRALSSVLTRWSTRWVAVAKTAVVAFVLAGPLAITMHAHPFGLASYMPWIGGTKGGASLGLNRQFWGYTSQNASEQFLAEHAKQGATVFIHDTAWDSWARMIDEGRIRSDLRGVGAPSQGDYALVQHELHMNEVEFQMWVAFGTRAPVYIVTHDDVPIVSIYQRP
ncbi:MAG TPA: glycosyltransferase family 39 protein [Polyangiaceae bacterium]|nr:MAG: Dolichyl-phosphate-mannose-protein mannosyltransferase [Deltaproteobacteria bacterium ADurb.Bin207]HNS95397.1 glycosyltransferase family 39 protein [Polyangiaceae bacterium]HNZ20663.1 glycosyltransferase family 39 protein [Polyangiaceae bacterium]HOD20721.1 glycosyltransferase family 39 protein [Polyangiaceae bacterium]HOE47141.1 glycosyltransferase family 39 protein [Polyangiaceae bacterium]